MQFYEIILRKRIISAIQLKKKYYWKLNSYITLENIFFRLIVYCKRIQGCEPQHADTIDDVLKLVTSIGLSISLASEFIENTPGRDFQKQDCEQKAFVRLAAVTLTK